MKLRGIQFGNPFGSSGNFNFFYDGWPQHKKYKLLCPWGFTTEGITKIAKTTTVLGRMPDNQTKGTGKGNLVIREDTLQLVDFKPDCIAIDFLRDRMANAVSLSGPGARNLFERGIWQKKTEPQVLSYMPVGKDKEARLLETREYVDITKEHLPNFLGPVAIEFNVNCPNTGHVSAELYKETLEHLEILQELGVPIILKLDVLARVEFMQMIERSGLCDAFDIPNSLKVGERPDRVDWKKLRYLTDPIVKKYGVCGYSGRENFDLAVEIIGDARMSGITLPIIGGGVSSMNDIRLMYAIGADAVSIGRASNTRFWNMKKLITGSKIIFRGAYFSN